MPLNNNGIGVQMFVRVVSAPLSVPRRGAAPTGGTAPGVPGGGGGGGRDAKKLRGAEASRSQDCCS